MTELDPNVVNDRRLSLAARGVYSVICYLQQQKGIAQPAIDDLTAYSAASPLVITAALAELTKVGVFSEEEAA